MITEKRRNGRQWRLIKSLLDPKNSEPCISTLLSVFDPLESDDGQTHIRMEALEFVSTYLNEQELVFSRAKRIAEAHGDKGFSVSGLEYQMTVKVNLINAVESFLLAHWDKVDGGFSEADISHLAESTLGRRRVSFSSLL